MSENNCFNRVPEYVGGVIRCLAVSVTLQCVYQCLTLPQKNLHILTHMTLASTVWLTAGLVQKTCVDVQWKSCVVKLWTNLVCVLLVTPKKALWLKYWLVRPFLQLFCRQWQSVFLAVFYIHYSFTHSLINRYACGWPCFSNLWCPGHIWQEETKTLPDLAVSESWMTC